MAEPLFYRFLTVMSDHVLIMINQTPRIALSVGPFVTEKYRIVHSQCIYDVYDAIIIMMTIIVICVRCDHHDDDDHHHLSTMR